MGQIAVGTAVESQGLADGIGEAGRDLKHRHVHGARIGTHPADQLEAVHPRHPDVHDQQVGQLAGQHRQRTVTVGRFEDDVARVPQVPADRVAVGLGVVHDEDAGGFSHGLFRSRSRPTCRLAA